MFHRPGHWRTSRNAAMDTEKIASDSLGICFRVTLQGVESHSPDPSPRGDCLAHSWVIPTYSHHWDGDHMRELPFLVGAKLGKNSELEWTHMTHHLNKCWAWGCSTLPISKRQTFLGFSNPISGIDRACFSDLRLMLRWTRSTTKPMFTRLIQPAPNHFSGRRNPEMLGEKPEIRAAATWMGMEHAWKYPCWRGTVNHPISRTYQTYQKSVAVPRQDYGVLGGYSISQRCGRLHPTLPISANIIRRFLSSNDLISSRKYHPHGNSW